MGVAIGPEQNTINTCHIGYLQVESIKYYTLCNGITEIKKKKKNISFVNNAQEFQLLPPTCTWSMMQG